LTNIGAKTFTRIPETEQELRLQENKYASCNRLLDAMATRAEPLQYYWRLLDTAKTLAQLW
jgi:hypothetical protein